MRGTGTLHVYGTGVSNSPQLAGRKHNVYSREGNDDGNVGVGRVVKYELTLRLKIKHFLYLVYGPFIKTICHQGSRDALIIAGGQRLMRVTLSKVTKVGCANIKFFSSN